MATLIQTVGPCRLTSRKGTPFQILATSIMSQQISAQAASSIKQRVLELIPAFTASAILAAEPERLRAAGLSSPKIRYLVQIARAAEEGKLDFETLGKQADEEVIETLIELPGVGLWTAEMFLIFALKRPDVLSLGDAGLKRAVKRLYGETMTLAEAGQAWRPYASTASWYLWRSLDAPRSALTRP